MELFANNAQTTLASAISSSAGTLTVALASAFPATGNFRILVDNELMLVTAVSGFAFTVSRAVESTSAASHAFGATVTLVATNGAMQAFRGDTNQQGTLANRPAAGYAGRTYQLSPGNVLYRDNGSNWLSFGPSYPLTDPTASSFSWVNQGSATVSTQYGGYYLSAPGGANAQNLNIYETAFGGASATMLLSLNGGNQTSTFLAGVTLRCPAVDARVLMFNLYNSQNAGGGQYELLEYTSPTVLNALAFTVPAPPYTAFGLGGYVWFHYAISAGNATVSISGDGITFGQLLGTFAPSFGLGGAATTIGVALNNYASGNPNIAAHLLHFSQP